MADAAYNRMTIYHDHISDRCTCPDCLRDMKRSTATGMELDLSGTAQEDDLRSYWEIYSCRSCGITFDPDAAWEERWKVPESRQPSERQKSTIRFINAMLELDIPAITKKQCWRETQRFFDTAKAVKAAADLEQEDVSEDDYRYDLETEYF